MLTKPFFLFFYGRVQFSIISSRPFRSMKSIIQFITQSNLTEYADLTYCIKLIAFMGKLSIAESINVCENIEILSFIYTDLT